MTLTWIMYNSHLFW